MSMENQYRWGDKTVTPYDKPVVELTGHDGNAYNILARCKVAARKAGWSKEHIDAVLGEMQKGDYDHLLQTAMRYFTVE